jgi:hypothetical protein
MATGIDTDHAPTLKATPARQGRWGKHIFWVLVISIVLAAIALFGSWGMRSGELASVEGNKGASTTAEAQQGTTELTAPKQTPQEQTAPAH